MAPGLTSITPGPVLAERAPLGTGQGLGRVGLASGLTSITPGPVLAGFVVVGALIARYMIFQLCASELRGRMRAPCPAALSGMTTSFL